MRKMKCILLLCLFAVMILMPMGIHAQGQRVVRVAMFPLGQFQYMNDKGEACGYHIDYLNKLAQTTHWKYEYVETDDFQGACALLKKGKVDLVAPVQRKDYLAADFEYSAYTMATECAAIYTMNNSKHADLLFEDFDAMKKMTFAAVNYMDSSFTQKFIDEYTVENKFKPKKIIYYDAKLFYFTKG